MAGKTKAKVMTRKQKKEVNVDRMSEEEAMTKIEQIQQGLCVSENALQAMTEELLLVEMRTMKAEELRLKLERKGLKSEVEMFLAIQLEDEKSKYLKSLIKKFGKLVEEIQIEGILLTEDVKLIVNRQEAASGILNNLKLSGHKNMVAATLRLEEGLLKPLQRLISLRFHLDMSVEE